MLIDRKFLLDTVGHEEIHNIVDELKTQYAEWMLEHDLSGTHALATAGRWIGPSAYALVEGPGQISASLFPQKNSYNVQIISHTTTGRFRFYYHEDYYAIQHPALAVYYGTAKKHAFIYSTAKAYVDVTLRDTSDNIVQLDPGEYLGFQSWDF
jgi:hypothetical protein